MKYSKNVSVSAHIPRELSAGIRRVAKGARRSTSSVIYEVLENWYLMQGKAAALGAGGRPNPEGGTDEQPR